MKKELLVASALATTLLGASVAQAATASFSGHSRNGVEGEDTDGTADGTFKASQQSSLSFSVSETTDSGIKVSTGFTVADEGAADGANTDGLTLTFTDGSKLDLIEAGNAYASQLASVPGASVDALAQRLGRPWGADEAGLVVVLAVPGSGADLGRSLSQAPISFASPLKSSAAVGASE